MHQSTRILLIQEVSSDATNLMACLRKLGGFEVQMARTLDEGILMAREGAFGVVLLSIGLADPRKGTFADLKKRFVAPVLFLLPGTPAPGSLPLEPWDWISTSFDSNSIQRAVTFAIKLSATENKLAAARQRLRDEEALADKGRVAARAALDFERVLRQVGDGLLRLREGIDPGSFGHLTALETAVSRAERLCQQLHGDFQRSPREAGALKPVQINRSTNTVLIVDDEESIRELSACVVQQVGWNVVTARDGEEALLRFQAEPHRFTAAILDLSLPRLTGIEVISGIRAIKPNLPIILITGHGDESLASDPRLALNGMLRKPFSTDALRAALARAVKQTASGLAPVVG
ncbi:MAG: response regulator [Opitutaceae bacterium]|nr:response regulator [Opitutaceae bacterium]